MAFDGRLVANVGVLAAIVESGSFARAADALGLSRSGVSRAVARLESRVGVRLLDRTTRSIALTDEGRRLHGEIGPLLTGIEDAFTADGRFVRGRARAPACQCRRLVFQSDAGAAYRPLPRSVSGDIARTGNARPIG
jgi:DNA-binding transcriptional LysR family regulator